MTPPDEAVQVPETETETGVTVKNNDMRPAEEAVEPETQTENVATEKRSSSDLPIKKANEGDGSKLASEALNFGGLPSVENREMILRIYWQKVRWKD
ncbi:hypothetical protein Dimus_036114 [Dionaea muscipula]